MTEPAHPLLAEAEEARSRELPRARAGALDRVPLLLFRVAAQWLACPAAQVEAILELQPTTPVPRTGPHVLGLVSHGDSPLAVLDAARLLGLEQPEERRDDLSLRRIVVVRGAGLRAGLVCERAAGVIELTGSERLAPSVLLGPRLEPFVAAEAECAQGRVGILDLDALLVAVRQGAA